MLHPGVLQMGIETGPVTLFPSWRIQQLIETEAMGGSGPADFTFLFKHSWKEIISSLRVFIIIDSSSENLLNVGNLDNVHNLLGR